MRNDLTLDEAKKLLLIDKNNLDTEVEYQSTIANRVGERMVEFESLRDAAKEKVSVTDAEIGDRLRTNAVDNKEKITEANLSAKILAHDDHKKAMTTYLDFKKKATLWKVMREDYVGKAFMVSQMCTLHEAEYYARVAVKDSIKDQIRSRMISERNERRPRVTRNDS